MAKTKNKKSTTQQTAQKTSVLEFPQKQKFILAIIVALVGFVLYFNTFDHKYVLDDYPTIKENKLTKKGLDGVSEIMKHSYWYGNDGKDDWLYRPLSVVMFAVEWELWPDNPKPGHMINVILYALTGFLTFLTLQKLLNKHNVIIPFVASLLFIAHPLHTEVVANIKSRDEILCFLFFLISLYTSVEYVRGNKLQNLLISMLSFGLALFSKESAATYLILIPLALFYFADFDLKKLLRVVIPMGIVFAVYMSVYLSVLGGHVTLADKFSIVDNTITGLDFMDRFPTCMNIIGYYLRLMVIPHPLVYDYSYNSFDIVGWTYFPAILSIVIYAGIGIYALVNFLKEKEIVFGIVIYMLPVILVSNIFLKTRSTAAERFLYLPSLGFCIIAAILITRLLKTNTIKTEFNDVLSMIKKNSTLFVITIAVVVGYGFKTIDRNMAWKDGETLYRTDLNYQPKSARVQYSYANDLTQMLVKDSVRDNMKKEQYFTEAMAGLTAAIKIHKGYYEPYFAIAQLYAFKLDYVKSLEYYNLAKQLNSEQDNLHNNIGNNYFRIGKLDSALKYLTVAIQKDPENAEAYSNLGSVYFTMGTQEAAAGHPEEGLKRQNDAIAMYNKSISINPNYFDGYKNLGSVYGTLHQYDKALNCFFKAIEINQRDPGVYSFIGMTYGFMGDKVKADEFQRKAQEVAAQRK